MRRRCDKKAVQYRKTDVDYAEDTEGGLASIFGKSE
jgi:hypothetical protein